MIDTHCHLEDPAFDKDLEEVIARCKKEMKAVIMSCPDWKDFDKSLEIARKYKGFVFLAAGIHPMYVNEVKPAEEKDMIDKIRKNKDLIIGIGEVGLDRSWIRDKESQEKQIKMFERWIEFANEIDKPLMIHLRDGEKVLDIHGNRVDRSVGQDAVEILEKHDVKRVHFHMFGFKELIDTIVKRGWVISANNIIQKSKTYQKVVARIPLENLMLETDCPWLGPEGVERNEPIYVKNVAERVAKEKEVTSEQVIAQTTVNAIKFYNLPIKA